MGWAGNGEEVRADSAVTMANPTVPFPEALVRVAEPASGSGDRDGDRDEFRSSVAKNLMGC